MDRQSKTSPFPNPYPDNPRSRKSLIIEEDLIEKLGGGEICDIPATSPKRRINCYPYWRPNKALCLDYSLSQNHIIVDDKKAKIFLRRTQAHYDWNPKPVIPRAKKFKFGNGMMPNCNFVDELWRDKVNARNQKYLTALIKRLAKKKKKEICPNYRKTYKILYRNLTHENYTYFQSDKATCICTSCLRYPKPPEIPDWY